MNFEVGHYYCHERGRKISIVCQTKTDAWGDVLIIEEADHTGFAITCAELKGCENVEKHGWVEIGKEEWLRMHEPPSCYHCSTVLNSGDARIAVEDKLFHPECFAKITKEQGKAIVVTDTLQ